jgi:hypothetical protein
MRVAKAAMSNNISYAMSNNISYAMSSVVCQKRSMKSIAKGARI